MPRTIPAAIHGGQGVNMRQRLLPVVPALNAIALVAVCTLAVWMDQARSWQVALLDPKAALLCSWEVPAQEVLLVTPSGSSAYLATGPAFMALADTTGEIQLVQLLDLQSGPGRPRRIAAMDPLPPVPATGPARRRAI